MFTELGLAGLSLAGAEPGQPGQPGQPPWTAVRGWADLERDEPLDPGHRFPAGTITMLVTGTAVLRMAAAGQLNLDAPVNGYLRTVRLADDAVTVRQLLTHTGGVANPGAMHARMAVDLSSAAGPVLPCPGQRGAYRYSYGGYAVLGQLIADVTGLPYPDAVTELVCGPLGMSSASFPDHWPSPGTHAVTGYELGPGGDMRPRTDQIDAFPAAGGLWATAADLARFGAGWPSLLPPSLARDAVRPQVPPRYLGRMTIGLGWMLSGTGGYLVGHSGSNPGAASSLILRVSTGQVSVALTNRQVPVQHASLRIMEAYPPGPG